MSDNNGCDHPKQTITTDSGKKKQLCPICDDVQVETLDEDE